MKFNAAILIPEIGAVPANECRDSEELRQNPISRRMMIEFKELLRENLTDDPAKTGKFRARFGGNRHILEWQHVEPMSAMGKFYVRGEIVAASFYLYGFVPEMDDAVLEATEVLFARWFGGVQKAEKACRGLRSIKERPVVIAVPGSKKLLSPADWEIIGNLCPCFAAVFFDRAAACIKNVETYWHNRRFRKGGDERDYRWN